MDDLIKYMAAKETSGREYISTKDKWHAEGNVYWSGCNCNSQMSSWELSVTRLTGSRSINT